MKSSRPYLLRAIHEWIVDNDCTPFLLVNAAEVGVNVPAEFVENDKIILNIGPTATQGLSLGNEEVAFEARFGGRPRAVSTPVHAILAIYARENGQGMLFTDEAGEGDPDEAGDGETGDGEATDKSSEAERTPEGMETGTSAPGRPNLKVIK